MTIEDPVEYVLPVDQPDPDQRAGRHHVRRRAQGDPAPGPRRDPRRRDARRRDRADRGAVGAHRPPRAVVAARHRRRRRRCTGSSTWASSRSSSRRRWSASSAQRLVRRICDSCSEPYEPPPTRSWRSTSSGAGSRKDAVLPRRGLQLLRRDTGYSGAHRRLRAADGHRRDRAAHRRGTRATTSSRARDREGMRTLRDEALQLVVEEDVTTISEILRSVYIDLTLAGGHVPKYKYVRRSTPSGATRHTASSRPRRRPSAQRAGRRRAEGCRRSKRTQELRPDRDHHRRSSSRAELMNFSRQIAAFVRAGIPILDALEVLERRDREQAPPKDVLVDVADALRSGERSPTRSASTRACSRATTSASSGRPSSPATSTSCSTSSRATSSATSRRRAQDQVGADLPGDRHHVHGDRSR